VAAYGKGDKCAELAVAMKHWALRQPQTFLKSQAGPSPLTSQPPDFSGADDDLFLGRLPLQPYAQRLPAGWVKPLYHDFHHGDVSFSVPPPLCQRPCPGARRKAGRAAEFVRQLLKDTEKPVAGLPRDTADEVERALDPEFN
jgi:hypothetical protein